MDVVRCTVLDGVDARGTAAVARPSPAGAQTPRRCHLKFHQRAAPVVEDPPGFPQAWDLTQGRTIVGDGLPLSPKRLINVGAGIKRIGIVGMQLKRLLNIWEFL